MATLALSAAGSAVGAAVLPGGLSLFGASLSGAALGGALGGIAGAAVDQAMFASSGQQKIVSGSRLSDLKVSGSTEGAPIPRVYGRARIEGQLIWATRLEEEVLTTSQPSVSGGKGLGGSGGGTGGQPVTSVEYRYYANLAFALCEGEITRVGRVWADGKELNQSDFTIRVYPGTQDQVPDSLIEAKEGAGNVPTYRGTAYVVFERMALARFGNRLPQLNFEVFRAVDTFEKLIQAITVIPGSGEFLYETDEVSRDEGGGTSVTENVHTGQGGTDWTVSMDQLQDSLPNVARASLFASWFGTDLRAGLCQIRPGVEATQKATVPKDWSVAGSARNQAHLISTANGRPAFGGTPSDESVVNALLDLKARGIAVTFCPFVAMDVAASNDLPDPYTGQAGQPAYPWRGRITVDPAPGLSGTPDKTPAADAQIDAFVGSALPSDFSVTGQTVAYSGPAEWSYRRMVLHYAHLCVAAGGVDSFLIGSELKGLTQVRNSPESYPFVAVLVQVAADVKAVLGPGTKVSYAADWSEYFGHHPDDGTGDVFFNLDPLWASPDIDAVAIDCYWPLADWRNGNLHLDRAAGVDSGHDLSYLQANISGGEGYDWYYASQQDRLSQTRTPITDGAHGKPWVFRFKDVRSWWQSEHFDRPGGSESPVSTAWLPQSKPIWFTEMGCPAIDKGANQPNVFFDPKSAESAVPHFSRGTRDDLIQRRYIEALLTYFDPTGPAYAPGNNPVSSLYQDRMIPPDRLYVYTWDARPHPAFPLALDVWADGGNWQFGHWLTGRVSGGPLPALVRAILQDFGFSQFAVEGLAGQMDGFVINQIISARQALQPLELAFFFDSFESSGIISFMQRGSGGIDVALSPADLADAGGDRPLYELTRSQETELPVSAKLTYLDGNTGYRKAAVEARRLAVRSERVATADLPVVMSQDRALAVAEAWLQDAWAAREIAAFALPPSRLALEPTDLVSLEAGGQAIPLRITSTSDGLYKETEARSIEPEVFQPHRAPGRNAPQPGPGSFGRAVALFLDLPLLRGNEAPYTGYVAAYQAPWPGGVAFYRSPEATGFTLNALVTGPATLGETTAPFSPGPTDRLDHGNVLEVMLFDGELQSVSDLSLLGGANVAAVENPEGEWEVLQFRDAELVAPGTYELRTLLRGQAGTEGAMSDPLPAGSRFVVIDSAVQQVDMTSDEINLPFNWRYGPASRDISHTSFQAAVHGFEGVGLRPFSPVHVRGEPSGNDLLISWVRRTRMGGDSWATAEVPLNESEEKYEVDILDGTNVVRTLNSSTPQVTYLQTQQSADWGTPPTSFRVRVHQVSAAYGRGQGREVQIDV